VVHTVLVILLSVLVWTARDIVARIERLEANQTQIMVTLHVPPVARENRGSMGSVAWGQQSN